jgi:hypothetical protein
VQDSAAGIDGSSQGTAVLENMFRHLHMSPETAVEFLAVFSRMEYALKLGGFPVGGDANVQANWDLFANTVNDAFMALTDAGVVEAREFLLQHPPRKQVLKGHKVTFVAQNIDAKQRPTQQVLLMVRTVRNNLFHGGKFLPDGEQEPGRNKLLVAYGLRVLLACSVLHEGVQMNFEH